MTSKLHALLNVRFQIVDRPIAALAPVLFEHVVDAEREYWIYEVPDHQPRATFCTDLLAITDPDAILATIESSRFVLGQTVILDKVADSSSRMNTKADTASTVTISEYRSQEVVLDVVATQDGIVVLADLFHPGWQATDNGQPVPILRANGICRGVAVTAGEHRLRFIYRPTSFYRGLWITGAILLLLAAAGVRIVLQRRHRTKTGS